MVIWWSDILVRNTIIFIILLFSFVCPVFANQSTCFGTTSNGYLVDGVSLPHSGGNFIAYSNVARLAGRTYVHSAVRDIILNAYERLNTQEPGKVYKYAETGFQKGGAFKPHKTHKNGLSVDFMTPMVDRKGRSQHLPTHIFNKLGYAIELDSEGRYKNLSIDYDALAGHIVALSKESRKLGYDIRRVIFDPNLQSGLFKTIYSEYLKKNVVFSKKQSWVRHDEHYHVDFAIPCKSR